MINVVLCGYRDWAKQVFDDISGHSNIRVVHIFESQEELIAKSEAFGEDVDIVLCVGWSWIIPETITNKYLCLGVHPSDLPNYRGGSPLQHQIIAGLTETKVTLMTLSSVKLDGGDLWLKGTLDLKGADMSTVFQNLRHSVSALLIDFFDSYPDLKPVEQQISDGSYFKRRTAAESGLTRAQFNQMSIEELYNFIRCLTDPYPNAYLQDESGNRLYFTGVKFVRAGNDSSQH